MNFSKWRAAITVRLEVHKRVLGILSVSAIKHFAEDRDEQELLEEITADIAYALHNIEREAIRKKQKRHCGNQR
jgi:transcriptional regulator with GAF, ATPase, and Fis domain